MKISAKNNKKVFLYDSEKKLLWANPFNGGYSTSHTILTKMELNESFFTKKKIISFKIVFQ